MSDVTLLTGAVRGLVGAMVFWGKLVLDSDLDSKQKRTSALAYLATGWSSARRFRTSFEDRGSRKRFIGPAWYELAMRGLRRPVVSATAPSGAAVRRPRPGLR